MPASSRIKKGLKMIFLLLLWAWLILAQFMMQHRIGDGYAKKLFAKNGVSLTTVTRPVFFRRMHYAQTGSDSLPTIVFIHGSPGSWSVFMRYMYDKDLLARFRMISIDRPGFGHSDFGHTMNLEKQSRLISSLLDSLSNGKPLYLAGHSLGGPLIVKLAADHPSLIKGLVIIAGSVDPAEEKKEYWRPVITYSPLRWLVPSAMRYSNEELWWLKKDLRRLADDFSKITCPVYIIHGDKDGLVPVGNAAYAKKMLVHAVHTGVTIIPGANHFIVWTRFEAVKKQLLALQYP